jgi:hypothetical protein
MYGTESSFQPSVTTFIQKALCRVYSIENSPYHIVVVLELIIDLPRILCLKLVPNFMILDIHIENLD